MPNAISATGLTIATRAELVTYFTSAYQSIYGADINLDSSSPDGQWTGTIIQAILDLEDLLVQIYNMFDPDNAIGVVLDQRVAINGIQRQAGTFSVTNITIVTSQALNLYGLDQSVQPAYTVQDNAGNKWQLQNTQSISVAGTYSYTFQAAVVGAVLTTPNTITIPVTVVLGVTSINNPTSQVTVGLNEESDAVLKVRRQKSVSLASQGYLKGLLAALENINGVTSAFVYENTGDAPDGDGVPGHSIWVIVAGTGAAADIANAIYTKRNAGCGMFGSTSYVITQVDGSPFTLLWDEVEAQNVFIFFIASSIDGVNNPNIAAIEAQLPVLYVPGVNEEVNVNRLATFVQAIDPNTLVTSAGFSNGQSQVLTLSGTAASGTFKINYNGNQTANINWNDSISTIQSKVRAVSGLGTAVVTGSIASHTLTFNLTSIDSVLGLLYVSDNILMTSAPAAITFSYNYSPQNILSPTSKKNQFAISSANIVITPLVINPSTASVVPLATQTFSAVGGYGTLVYSLATNASGGSIDSSSGLYTAGVSSGTDIVQATDVLGNFIQAVVSVS